MGERKLIAEHSRFSIVGGAGSPSMRTNQIFLLLFQSNFFVLKNQNFSFQFIDFLK